MSNLREEDKKFTALTDKEYRFSQNQNRESPERTKSLAETVTLLQASESAEEAGILARRPMKRPPSQVADGRYPTRLCNLALVVPVPWPRHSCCHSSYKQLTENQNTRNYPVDAEG